MAPHHHSLHHGPAALLEPSLADLSNSSSGPVVVGSGQAASLHAAQAQQYHAAQAQLMAQQRLQMQQLHAHHMQQQLFHYRQHPPSSAGGRGLGGELEGEEQY
jgi:hypothetical protein